MKNDHLDELFDQVSGCQAASYANMETGVTFLSANRSGVDQNELARTCDRAARLLGPANEDGDAQSDFAIVVTRDAVDLFWRSAFEPQEVIACTFGTDTVASDALQAMQNVVEKIHDQ